VIGTKEKCDHISRSTPWEGDQLNEGKPQEALILMRNGANSLTPNLRFLVSDSLEREGCLYDVKKRLLGISKKLRTTNKE